MTRVAIITSVSKAEYAAEREERSLTREEVAQLLLFYETMERQLFHIETEQGASILIGDQRDN